MVIKYQTEAERNLRKAWGNDAERVIKLCEEYRIRSEYMNMSGFLDRCTACGGDWGGMFLTGIAEIAPEIFEALPLHLESNGNWMFIHLCYVIRLIGIDIPDD